MKKLLLLMMVPILGLGACKPKADTSNPLLQAEWTTEYGFPPFDQIRPEHFMPALTEAFKQHKAEIDAIVNNSETPSFENTVLAFDNAGAMLERVASIFYMISGSDSNDALNAVEEEMSPLLTAHFDDISLNDKLFERIKSVHDRRSELGLNELQTRLLEKQYRNFVRSGALLDAAQKEQLRTVNTDLSAAEVKFRNNLLADTKGFQLVITPDEAAGVPEPLKAVAAERAKDLRQNDKLIFTLDDYIPFMTYAENRNLRRQMNEAYTGRCAHKDSLDNSAVVNDMVRLRLERSKLLGYENYATYTLEERMAKTPEAVYGLLDQLWTPALEGAKKEMAEMQALKGDNDFAAWDWWFYAEKVRKEKYDLQEDVLKPYFSLPQVQSGIFELANRLYGITFEPVALPVYNKDCATFRVLDADGQHLAVLLLDMYQRGGKRGGAWCGAYRGREFDATGNKTFDPIVYVSCNFPHPAGSTPTLLTLTETTTFFHEFGHALHNFFNMSPYKGLDDTERDFVELPSQLLENWAFEPELLRHYAVRWDAKGEVIPDELIQKIQNSAYFNQGFQMTEYLAASLSDMDIHTLNEYSPIDLGTYETDILNTRRGLITQIAPRYKFPYFNHIFGGGYAVGYYGYKWAEVLDKDAFEAFTETGDVFNREVADRFRREVLSKGGTADGMVLYHNFRGKEPSLDYLLYASGLKERPVTDSTAVITEQPVL